MFYLNFRNFSIHSIHDMCFCLVVARIFFQCHPILSWEWWMDMRWLMDQITAQKPKINDLIKHFPFYTMCDKIIGKNSSEKRMFSLLLHCKSLEHNRTNIFPLKLQVQPFDWIYIQTQLIESKYVIVYKIKCSLQTY